VRLHVDPTKCDGYGVCAEILPEVFKLDEWGYASVEGDAPLDAAMEERAVRAVAECPAKAIAAQDSEEES